MQHHHVFETKLGFCGIAWSDDGITRFRLPYTTREAAEAQFHGKGEPAAPPPHIAEVIDQATRYFAGEQIDFSAIGLDLSAIDPARRTIYDALRKVEFGKTVTYGELAKRAGATEPQAAQEVGIAMARNPVPLIIPCHRVLAAGGKLGGLSGPRRVPNKQHTPARRGVL